MFTKRMKIEDFVFSAKLFSEKFPKKPKSFHHPSNFKKFDLTMITLTYPTTAAARLDIQSKLELNAEKILYFSMCFC